MELKFSKYEGAGNDFVMLDYRWSMPCELTEEFVKALCDRRFGVGADGLIAIERGSEGVDFGMRYFNSDGRQSTMCGNGGRCAARMADDLGLGGRAKHFSAVDGLHTATLNDNGTISLQMIDIEVVERIGEDYFVQTGSPHYVIFKEYDHELALARRREYDANVNFVTVDGLGRLSVRTFERGVEAQTWACGTGVTAAAVVTNFSLQPACEQFEVDVIGGLLSVSFKGSQGQYRQVILTGPARKVFEGTIKI